MSPPLRRGALAALAGACWALAHPPAGAWPLSFLVLPLLLAALHDDDARSGWLGFVTGFVASLVMLGWARNITPGGLLAWPLLAVVHGLWMALYGRLARRWLGQPGAWAALAALFVGIEVLRSSVPLGGFGWGELSYAHAGITWLTPIARLVGGRGITLVVAVVGAFLFEAWRRPREALAGLQGSWIDHLNAALPHAQPALLGLAGTLVVSVLATVEPPAPVGRADVLVVQGNGREEWGVPGRERDVLVARSHLELTREAVADGPAPDLVVWPESSVDDDPARRPELDAIVQEAAALSNGRLLVGVKLDGPDPDTFYNTLHHVAADGSSTQPYVKQHLVPFGEYVPFRSALDWVPPLRAVPLDGVPGDGPVELVVDQVRVAAAICFETLFGDVVRHNVNDGDVPANLVVAVTNDASFGRGAQSAQHIAQSRLRAVETGRWVVHAAVSGASAFVDPDGAVHDVTGSFQATTIRREVDLVDGRTPFLATGDWLGRLAALATAVEVVRRTVLALRRRRTTS